MAAHLKPLSSPIQEEGSPQYRFVRDVCLREVRQSVFSESKFEPQEEEEQHEEWIYEEAKRWSMSDTY